MAERKEFKWESVTAISSLLVAFIALLALGFSWRQLEDYKDATNVQRLIDETRSFESSDFVNIRKNLARKRLDSAGKLKPLSVEYPPAEMYAVLNYFEHIGLLVEKRYLDANDTWDELSYWILNVYADAKPMIDDEQRIDPQAYKHVMSLVAVMRHIETSAGRAMVNPSVKEIEQFYGYERSQPAGAVIPKQR